MTEKPLLKIDQQDFRRWLREAGRLVVGQACIAGDCPIANYLKEREKVKVGVCGSEVYIYRLGTFVTPRWVEAFIEIVDNQTDAAITGNRALDILDEEMPSEDY